MTYIRHIKSMLPLLSALIMALTLTACSLIMEPGYDGDEPGDFIEIKFRMVAGNVLSRANNWEDVDVSGWQVFEDYINTDDLAFFIFLNKSDTDMPLLLAVTGQDDQNTSVAGILGEYTLTARIPKDDFETVSGSQLSPTSEEISFRMVVLANTGADFTSMKVARMQFSDFIEEAAKLNFDMADKPDVITDDRSGTAYYTGSSDTSVASLYKGTIPMYGLLNFKARKDDLYYSTEASRLWLGEIHLLRSLAKISVVQQFDNGEVEPGYPCIQSVSVQSATTAANVLPLDPGNYDNYNDEISFRPNINNGNTPPAGPFNLGYLEYDKKTWSGYFPEQTIADSSPVITIWVKFEKDSSAEPFTVKMNDYKSTFGTHILRHHIYTIIATIEGGVTPTVTIKPYDEVILNPDFGLTPRPEKTDPPSQAR